MATGLGEQASRQATGKLQRRASIPPEQGHGPGQGDREMARINGKDGPVVAEAARPQRPMTNQSTQVLGEIPILAV